MEKPQCLPLSEQVKFWEVVSQSTSDIPREVLCCRKLLQNLLIYSPSWCACWTPAEIPCRHKKNNKGRTSPEATGEAPQPLSKAQKSSTGKYKGNPATTKSLDEKQEKQACSLPVVLAKGASPSKIHGEPQLLGADGIHTLFPSSSIPQSNQEAALKSQALPRLGYSFQ